MTSLIGDLYLFAQALEEKLVTNQEALGLQAVFYGDQQKIPTTPIACVEPDVENDAYKGGGAGRMFSVDFGVYILLYHSLVASPQTNRLGSDEMAAAIKKLIHQDRTLGGLVIENHVASIQSGYATKANSLVRASRILVTATSQTLLLS